MSPQLNISSSLIQGAYADIFSTVEGSGVLEGKGIIEQLFAARMPYLYVRSRLWKKHGIVDGGNIYASIKKILKPFALNFELAGTNFDNYFSLDQLLYIFFSKKDEVIKREQIFEKLARSISSNKVSLGYDVQLCDAWDPGPSSFFIYYPSRFFLDVLRVNAREDNLNEFVDFLATVIDSGNKYELYYAVKLGHEILKQIEKNETAGFSEYSSAALGLLGKLRELNYNRKSITDSRLKVWAETIVDAI